MPVHMVNLLHQMLPHSLPRGCTSRAPSAVHGSTLSATPDVVNVATLGGGAWYLAVTFIRISW